MITANPLAFLSIEAGAKLVLTVNGSSLHIKGNIRNLGELILWNSNSGKGTLFLHGHSYWSGAGVWTLSQLNLDLYGLEFDDDMVISFADNITGNSPATINKLYKRERTIFKFSGTENASIPSDGSMFFYPGITVNKSASSGPVSLAFKDNTTANPLQLLGPLALVSATDRLLTGSMNTITIKGNIAGNGSLSGAETADLAVAGTGPAITSLRLTTNTVFNKITVIRPSGVTFQNSFTARTELMIAAGSSVTLPSNATVTLGVNGGNPGQGNLVCQGTLYAGTASGITVRGNGTSRVVIGLSQASAANFTLEDLVINRMPGAGEVMLADASALIIDGTLRIDSVSTLNLSGSRLFLNLSISIQEGGWLTGSEQASVYIQGSGGNATLRFNPGGPPSNRTLKYIELNRTSGRIITLANTLYVKEQLNVLSGKLNSNGYLVLLSSATGSAAIGPLSSFADVLGDVTVQCWLSGGAGMRGTRMLSPPVDDALSDRSVFRQIQEQVLITGPGGVASGFDPGGPLQPQAITIQTYYEPAGKGQVSYRPLPDIFQRCATSAYVGSGFGFFLYFRGNRSDPFHKLNATSGNYAVPEDVVISYKGPVYKRSRTVTLGYTNNAGDVYNGYHVIGNPYPSTIDWRQVSRTNTQDMIAIIKPGGGMITYSNGVVVNSPVTGAASALPYIQPGQAFYVKALGPEASVTFNETCKAVNASPDRLLVAPGKKFLPSLSTAPGWRHSSSGNQEPTAALLRIQVAVGTAADETAIVFNDQSKPGTDELDAVAFPGTLPAISSLSNDLVKLAINFIPGIVDSMRIPLNIQVPGKVNASLKFSRSPGLEKYDLFLHDLLTGRLTPIPGSEAYNFTQEADNSAAEEGRFEIIFKSGKEVDRLLEGNSILVYPNPVKTRINVQSSLVVGPPATLVIYDMLGCKRLSFSGFREHDISGLQAGQYIAELQTASGKVLGRARFLKE
ncbi:T9SS type A sorting domain-containing protein [Hufsiella ginkgonis]|uniref:T9SS type A sorting domain-containing protein n=1 Tax=Hufsiella ginkgonis TaxID=2695274 RepID=A0A7K1XTE5_9SPHI|nr:T9SS type A sorting domain-containing protein [Hufsiella ginkgonis]MXV14234.1 T9SS type A sorting domain-containing protein [Hufsiella ginkgonis]